MFLSAGTSISTGYIETHSYSSAAGGVSLTAGSNISTFNIDSSSYDSLAGGVVLTSGGNISAGSIDSSSNHSVPGPVVLTAGSGISTGHILTRSQTRNGGAVTIKAGSSISADYFDLYSGYRNGGALTLMAGSDIHTGYIITYAFGSGSGGDVVLTSGSRIATGFIESAGWQSSSSNGGSIMLISVCGVSTERITTSTAGTGKGGSVVILTGNNSNDATLTVGEINTSGGSGGMVELVNSAANTSSVDLTTNGAITTDATGLNGIAGPVSLVSSGAISATYAINARAIGSAASVSAMGGSVFISSGGTGSTAIAVGSINTSATGNGAGNKAGNIILLSAASSSRFFPSNISADKTNFTQQGGIPGIYLIYGLAGASTVLPERLNVTPAARINIRPGGYQSASSSYISLHLDTGGDTQMVVPVNIGAGGTSLYLASISQASGSDNISIVLAGGLTTNGPISAASRYVGL